MQSAHVSLWCFGLPDGEARARRAGELAVAGFSAMIVLFVLQMHLQKDPGVEVMAERDGLEMERRVRSTINGGR